MELHWKWKLGVLSVLALGAVLSSAAAVRSFALVRTQNEQAPPAVERQYTDYAAASYVLGEAGGYVAVFSGPGGPLLETTDIPVSRLRAADQALLRQGITAADRAALLELLEDFGS